MRFLCSAILLSVGFAQSAAAQSIFDTLRNIGSTVKQITKPQNKAPATVASQAPDSGDEAGDLISVSMLANDPNDTNLEQAAIRSGDPMSFDVLGIKLGMSPRELGRVAKKMKIKHGNAYPITSGDLEFEATRIANSTLSKKVSDSSKILWRSNHAEPSNGAYMHIETNLTPLGPQISNVQYNPRLEGQTQDEFLAALKQKYGQPTSAKSTGGWRSAIWCTRGAARCSFASDKPVLAVFYSDSFAEMTLSMGSDAKNAAEAALKRRASEIRAGTGRKVSF